MKKRFVSAILCMFAIFGVLGLPSVQAASTLPDVGGAASSDEPALRWVNTASITLNMSRSNNKVTSETVVTGKAGTTSISASFTLERLVNGNYVLVDSWTASSSSMLLKDIHTTSNCPSGTYKLTVEATVTRNGTSEYVSDSLSKSL